MDILYGCCGGLDSLGLTLPHVLLDVGWRKGMSRQAAAWQWTMGFTWSLTFPVGPHASLRGGTP